MANSFRPAWIETPSLGRYRGQTFDEPSAPAHERPLRSMFEQAFKNIDDVLWKDAGCTSELDYTEQTSWLLFLKYLDALERDKATEAQNRREDLRPRRRFSGLLV